MKEREIWTASELTHVHTQTDPGQMHNLYSSSPSQLLLGTHIDLVINRLDALMMVLKSCQGGTCVEPWKVLHPQGDVASLSDALKVRFDAFYEEQVKVSFDRCELGYLIDAEGPQAGQGEAARAYEDGYEESYDYGYREGTRWFDWV